MCKKGESESGKWSGTDAAERQLTENIMDRRRQDARVGNSARWIEASLSLRNGGGQMLDKNICHERIDDANPHLARGLLLFKLVSSARVGRERSKEKGEWASG
jgi:hypothetical protein